MQVKICGLTNADDAVHAAELGADYVGFVFHPDSPRAMTTERGRRIVSELAGLPVKTVGVFVDRPVEEVLAVVQAVGLDVVQLHGQEPPEWCELLQARGVTEVWKALRLSRSKDLDDADRYPTVDGLLVERDVKARAGGTGIPFPWAWLDGFERAGRRLILAGGLTPENVTAAIGRTEPDVVDVTSGVEARPGRKDPARLAAFIQRARGEWSGG